MKAIYCMEINGNPFAAQLRWGLTASPMTYDPPVTDLANFAWWITPSRPIRRVPWSRPTSCKPSRRTNGKTCQGIPMGWLTSEFGGGGSPVANVEFLKQVGCTAEMVRLRDYGISGNGNLMLLEKNNHEVFGVMRDWLDRKAGKAGVRRVRFPLKREDHLSGTARPGSSLRPIAPAPPVDPRVEGPRRP